MEGNRSKLQAHCEKQQKDKERKQKAPETSEREQKGAKDWTGSANSNTVGELEEIV